MIAHIFKKELREMMRDKRVFYGAIVGPVFLVALMLGLIGMVESTIAGPKAQKLHVVQVENKPVLLQALEKAPQIEIVTIGSLEAGEKLVEEGDARVVVEFPEDFDARLNSGQQATFKAVYDEDEVRAQVLVGILQRVVDEVKAAKVAMLLEQGGVAKEMANPIVLDRQPIKKAEEGVGMTLAGFLPYLIVLWAFYGAMSIASDIVAGEKERQTLETLLISPATRTQIAMGKFWALVVVGFVSSISSLLTVLIMGASSASTAKILFPQGMNIGVGMLGAMVAVILPLVMMFAGILLAISAFARNTREAQTYLTMVSFLVLMPAIFSQFIGFTDFAQAGWISLVPVLNSAMVLREALLGKLELANLAITVGISMALAWVTVSVAVRLFNREQVLVRI